MTDLSKVPTSTALAEWRQGWPVVLAAGIGYGTGGSMVLLLSSLFLQPMQRELGWSLSAVAIAPIVTLVWALFYPVAGAAIDRFGANRVAIVGALGLALSVAALAVVPITPASLYGLAVLIGLSSSLTSVPTFTRAVASWFKHGAGLAFGVTLSGSAAVSIVATPLVQWAITQHGWRTGYLIFAGIILVVGLPATAIWCRERRQDAPATPDAAPIAVEGRTLGQALGDGAFWAYLAAFTIACIPLGGTISNLAPLVTKAGIAVTDIAFIGVGYAIMISVGKMGGGLLLDRIWPFGVAAAISFISAAGALGVAYAGAGSAFWVVTIMVWAIGLAQGAEGDFIAFFSLRSFGMRAFSRIVGLIGMMGTLGISAGSYVYGLLFDRFGDYGVAGIVGSLCLVASGVLLILVGLFERQRPVVAEAFV